jgi:hypothetical protein
VQIIPTRKRCPGRKNGQPFAYVGFNAESESLGSVGKLEEYNWE